MTKTTHGKPMAVPACLARVGDNLVTRQGAELITEIIRDCWEVLIRTPIESRAYARTDQITVLFKKGV